MGLTRAAVAAGAARAALAALAARLPGTTRRGVGVERRRLDCPQALAVDGAAVGVAAATTLVAVAAATAFAAVAAGPRSWWRGNQPSAGKAAAGAAAVTGLAPPAHAPGPTRAGLAAGPTSGAVGAERRSEDRQLAGRVDRPALAFATVAGAPAAATFAPSTTGTRVGPVPGGAVGG